MFDFVLARITRAIPPTPEAPAIANAEFAPYDRMFFRLYELCRYNSLICTDRVIRAARADNGANGWLLLSSVGAGCAGTVKLVTGLATDDIWEAASVISIGLAVWALFKQSGRCLSGRPKSSTSCSARSMCSTAWRQICSKPRSASALPARRPKLCAATETYPIVSAPSCAFWGPII